ncbi:MAG: hypothetical protein H7246_10390 [Phycisphaerae bacterium]|nr:hypothetical protein [Saprospiraceae bacterium]
MKLLIIAVLTVGYFLWSGCHNLEPLPPEEKPLTCEDTIWIFHPGIMEHGFIKAIKTCRDWKASGEVRLFNTMPNHMSISGNTYSAYALTNGDTSFLLAEGIYFEAPKKVGKFPLFSTSNLLQDKASCTFSKIDIDVVSANWSVDDTEPDNNIEITEIDTLSKRVKGRFNVHLKKDFSVSGAVHFPSKLYFKDGEFDVEIIN